MLFETYRARKSSNCANFCGCCAQGPFRKEIYSCVTEPKIPNQLRSGCSPSILFFTDKHASLDPYEDRRPMHRTAFVLFVFSPFSPPPSLSLRLITCHFFFFVCGGEQVRQFFFQLPFFYKNKCHHQKSLIQPSIWKRER